MDEDSFTAEASRFLGDLLGDRANGLTADTKLIETGLLDSLSVLSFVSFLEGVRGAPLEPSEITLESLSTIRSSYALLDGRAD